MAKYGSDDVTLEFDNAGGSLVDMSDYLRQDITIDRKAETVESTPYSVEWAQAVATGMKRMEPVTLTGFYDDTATTGPEVIFFNAGVALGATRTFKVTYGGAKTTSVETIIANFRVKLSVGQLHVFEVVLQPTGTVTEA